MTRQDRSGLDLATEVPVRSYFYALPPREVGTSLVEGLTRYFSRLAAAHRVTVSDFICDHVFDGLFPVGELRRDKRRSFLARCYLLDGAEAYTNQWVRALASATTQTSLRATTLFPYLNVCQGSWLRRHRAWCPKCLTNFTEENGGLYEPLLWSVRVVTVCPIHVEPLFEQCPYCHRVTTPLAGYDAPGICARCCGALWETSGSSRVLRHEDDNGYKLWAAEQAAALIAAMKTIVSPFSSATVAGAIGSLVSRWSAETKTSVANAAGCTRRSIELWCQGTTRPRAESLFRLCFHIGMPVLDFLRSAGLDTSSGSHDVEIRATTAALEYSRTGDHSDGSVQLLRCVIMPDTNQSRAQGLLRSAGLLNGDAVKGGRKHRASEIQSTLQEALNRTPSPTLHDVAISLSMINSSVLRVREPALCDELLLRRKRWKSEQQLHAREILLSALQKEDLPGLKRLCRKLGISFEMICSRFPEVRQEHSAAYRLQMHRRREARKAVLQSEVDRAVRVIRDHEEYPSADRVVRENPTLRSYGWHQIQEAIQIALTLLD